MDLPTSFSDYSLSVSTNGTAGLTSSYQMDPALQNTLKRVSREIQLRKNEYKDSKQPVPPVYEMIGNSVAYQLLLQPHPSITVELINSMYPILKNLQSSAQELYDNYLEDFKRALKKKATPQCLHPPDIPTVKFLVDLCVHASSMPLEDKNVYISPTPSLWMNLLGIFSASPQNQACLVQYKCASKVVGCMNLTSMADDIKLQCHGWEVLSNILQCPLEDLTKPAVHIQAITLLLGHIRRQCEQFYHDDNLMKAVLKFLSKLTSITRACSLNQCAAGSDTPLSYTKEDALEIIALLEETSIRAILLDLPEHLQDDLTIKTTLQSVLLSLAPTIIVPPIEKNEMSPPSAVPMRKLPPPKPKRSKVRSQFFSPNMDYIRPTPRKLPEIPNKKRVSLSKSSENLAEIMNHEKTFSLCDTDYSLPVGIISHASRSSTKRRSSLSSPSKSVLINEKEKSEEVPFSKPRMLSSDGPEQLPHYNRVSLKRTRGSYIKAVTASQKRFDGGGEESKENFEQSTKTVPSISSEVENKTGAILQALKDRQETMTSIVQLWKADKSLQAVSNLVMSCFFGGDADFPLFVDCLNCFCSYPSQWSLGICIVLLPYLRKTASSDFHLKYFQVMNSSVALIMKRFSVIILGIKKNKYTSRVHLEQRQACYHELHLLFATITKLEKTLESEEEIHNLIEILAPFNEPLSS